MKKLFALALAVVMLTITAYAANTDAPAPADYEKVTIYWNELDDPLDLDALGIDPARTMIKFRSGGMGQKPMAGGYVSSGLVTTSLCRGDLTLDFWVEEEVVGFFKVNEKPKGEEIDKLFPSDANKKYYFFEFSTLDDDDNIIPVEEFTFHRPATLYVHTAGKNSYIYELKDGRLSSAGHYFEEDDSWVIETKTLGNYIVSDKPLTLGNPTADSEPAEDRNSESESNWDALNAAMDKILKIEARPWAALRKEVPPKAFL